MQHGMQVLQMRFVFSLDNVPSLRSNSLPVLMAQEPVNSEPLIWSTSRPAEASYVLMFIKEIASGCCRLNPDKILWVSDFVPKN
jgi:hypothetical protein